MGEHMTSSYTTHRRREDPPLVLGQGKFVSDFADADTLHAAFVRSPEAHAAVGSIDTSLAAELPGVVAVFAAADLDLADIPGDHNVLPVAGFRRPPLARHRVRYAGEPMAVVIARTPAQAMDGTESVLFDLDALPPVIDPAQSSQDLIVLHEDPGTNVVERYHLEVGPAPAEVEVEVSVTVENQRVAAVSVEPLTFLALPDPSGGLHVLVGHQRPHGFRAELARQLNMAPESIRVTVPEVGGAFGMKGLLYPEYLVVAAVALRLGQPVLWVERRREHLGAGSHGRAQRHTVTLAGTADGRLLSARFDILAEVGAYPHNGSGIPTFTRYVATGLYDIPRVEIGSTTVVTNLVPTGSYRGAGRPEAAYAIERAIDAFAHQAGLDPVEVRLRNVLPPDALPHRTATGALYDSGDYPAALHLAVDLIDLHEVRREQASRQVQGADPLGVGFGAFVERAGGAITSGEYGRVEIDREGTVIVRTGSLPSGQGHETVWSELVARQLSVDPEKVRFIAGDTALVGRGVGTMASRSAQLGGSAVWNSAGAVRELVLKLASSQLEAAEADLVLENGKVAVVGSPGSGVDFATLAAAASESGLDLAAEDWFAPGAQTFPYGVHAAVVEVSLETGEVTIRKMVTVDDCGNILNPMIVEGQVQGSLVQGIGQALYEGVVYSEDGQPLTSTLVDYQLPRAGDIPLIVSGRLCSPAPSNPLGVKGTGEAGCIGGPPAIVNAVLDALRPYGVTHLDMPLQPHKVWTALARARR